MSSIQDLKFHAVSLGLVGDDIAKFVLKQQAYEREKREKAREEREREKAREERECEKAREERERAREQELKLAELEAKKIETARAAAPNTSSFVDLASRFKLPVLQEGEDITTYLNWFERVSELLEVDKSRNAILLGSLLTCKAAEMYTSFSVEITKDYDLLKKALLTGFNKTPDGCRAEFRSAKISPGETFQQFSFHLIRLFQAWLEASGVGNDFDILKDFTILDQFLPISPPRLASVH